MTADVYPENSEVIAVLLKCVESGRLAVADAGRLLQGNLEILASVVSYNNSTRAAIATKFSKTCGPDTVRKTIRVNPRRVIVLVDRVRAKDGWKVVTKGHLA